MAFHNLLNFCIVFFSLYWLPLLASPAAELRSTSSSWQQYIRAPTNRIVHPVRILSDLTAGNVTNADGLLKTGGGSTTLSRAKPPTPPSWPAGTNANASSFHAANTNNGQPRTYNPGNAIDGDLETFWNDDTIAAYPDILTITAPSAVNLSGITIQSNSDGVPQDFTVDVLENNAWTLAGTISGNTNIRCPVSFGKAVSTKAIRITVTRDQSTSQGEFTRINEVWPGIVPPDPAAPRVVVDFGQNIVGFLQVAFAGASANYPGVRFAFSETTEYLTNISDFTRSDNVRQHDCRSHGETLIHDRAIRSHQEPTNFLFLLNHLPGLTLMVVSMAARSARMVSTDSDISRSTLTPWLPMLRTPRRTERCR